MTTTTVYNNQYKPQILMGASNSSSAGWDKKIARDLTHKPTKKIRW